MDDYVFAAVVFVAGLAYAVMLILGSRHDDDRWTGFVDGTQLAITIVFMLIAALVLVFGAMTGWCTSDCI